MNQPKLSAPANAQAAHAKLKKAGRLGDFFFMPKSKKKGRREARPASIPVVTSATPTVERKYKEPYGWTKQDMTGGQVLHRRQIFLDVYDKHLDEEDRVAADLLQKAWEIANRVRITSARAYTGMPFTGSSGDREGHAVLSPRDREDLALFAHACDKLNRFGEFWWLILAAYVLHEPDERTGKVSSVGEIGAAHTAYKKGSDLATAAGVALGKAALRRWREALQEALYDRQYRRMRRDVMEAEITSHVERRRIGR